MHESVSLHVKSVKLTQNARELRSRITFGHRVGLAKVPVGLVQGVVTYTSPVEAFATGIKNFDR